MLAEKLGLAEAVNLLLPVMAICTLTVWRGFRAEPGAADSLTSMLGSAIPFLAGVTVPLLVLAAPYLATGSLGDLYTGLFVTPRGRLESGLLRDRRTCGGRLRNTRSSSSCSPSA